MDHISSYFQDDSETQPSQSLATFLVKRALSNRILGNFLYWYLLVECKNKEKKVNQACLPWCDTGLGDSSVRSWVVHVYQVSYNGRLCVG